MRIISSIRNINVSRRERYMKPKKTHLMQIAVLIAISLFIMTPVLAEAASIYLDPAKPPVSHNEEFTVSVKIDSVSDLSAYQFDINYKPRHYEIVKVEEGSFLNNNSTDSTFFLVPDSSDSNLVTIACTRMGKTGGIDGSGTLVNITFRSKTSGNAKINIVGDSVRLLDTNGQKIQ